MALVQHQSYTLSMTKVLIEQLRNMLRLGIQILTWMDSWCSLFWCTKANEICGIKTFKYKMVTRVDHGTGWYSLTSLWRKTLMVVSLTADSAWFNPSTRALLHFAKLFCLHFNIFENSSPNPEFFSSYLSHFTFQDPVHPSSIPVRSCKL